MADILLTHSNHLHADPKQVRKMQPYPPLQTLLAAACLTRRGFSADLFDATFEDPRPGFERALAAARPRLVAVVEDNFNFLTKMCLTANREIAFEHIRLARAAGVPVLVNGSDSTDNPQLYLAAGADAVILGEVEQTLVEAAEALIWSGPESLSDIPGLALPAPTRPARQTPPRPRLADLDSLPDPAWDLAPIDQYRRAWRDAHGRFSLNLISSRGCPYRCNWCAKPIYGSSFHTLSPAVVARQMATLKHQLGAEHIWFADDIFALYPEWTRDFAREVDARDASLPFKMQSRCGLMTRDVVADLVRAGCEEVWMGAESGSQSVLDAMDKDMGVDQIAAARENLRSHGVRACYFLQFGYPGETWEDIQATVAMVRRTRPDDVGVSVSYPLPGTKFYDRVAGGLQGKKNWVHSDDLAMMFKGAYSTELYRALHDAIHLEVESFNRRPIGDAWRLSELWRKVERLEEISAHAEPTKLSEVS